MDYVALRVELDHLGDQETDRLAAEAARYDIDIDDLPTEMAVDRIRIVVSTLLALLIRRLGPEPDQPSQLWGLLRRPIESRSGDVGVLDEETRVTFVWDQQARRDSKHAIAAMVQTGQAIAEMRRGAVLRWSSDRRGWTSSDQPTIVILTALPLEYEAVRRYLPGTVIRSVHPAGTVFEIAAIAEPWRLALSFVGRGGYGTAVYAERAIAAFAPSAVLFVGIAGALREDLRLGDVVIGTHVHPFQIGREEDGGFKPQPRTWAASAALVQQANQVLQDGAWRSGLSSTGARAPRAVLAPLAAGEIVLNAKKSPSARVLREQYSDAAAVEMESAGLAAAVERNPLVHALPIRGLSDYADGNKDLTDRDGRNQPRAAEHAASFAYALVQAIVTAGAKL
ncbi:hypothetical protein [Dactylosporangium sp. CA-092794]|uniref:5'-methylthioadenosine/S-adenosylhomocysteine nucleosidase family protein n=1 Tax=Dactylosporangium sp. CA-092794 TaxID=3239929 RepID=UPI003D8DFBB3